MNFFFVLCLFSVASAAVTTAPKTTRKAKKTVVTHKDVHLAKDQSTCLSKNGKWVEITLTDEGGDNGLQLDIVKVDKQAPVKSLKTPNVPKGRRLSRRGDVVTFKDSFCLDYYGKDYAPCYDIVTSSQGKNLEELSWSLKVAAMNRATDEEKKAGGKDKIVEAIKEGAAYDDVKVLCGRLFKQLGRFTDRQIAKLQESLAEDDGNYRHQKVGDKYLRVVAKISQKAEDLRLTTA